MTKLQTITLFEDPVYSTYIDKDIFIDIYEKVLDTFDGGDMTSFIDFYFEPSPVNTTLYIFRDEDVKLDFRDFAIELGLIPEIKEIMEGESKKDKDNRSSKPNNHMKQIHIKQNRVKQNNTKQTRTKQAQITFDKLMNKLKEETDPLIRSNIERKIQNTLKHINTSV
jgi:DNA-binding transcriptional MerR regulator